MTRDRAVTWFLSDGHGWINFSGRVWTGLGLAGIGLLSSRRFLSSGFYLVSRMGSSLWEDMVSPLETLQGTVFPGLVCY